MEDQGEDQPDRVYMVIAEDENGDTHLFATGALDRAERALSDMKTRYGAARANWQEHEAWPSRAE
jgi:hypothetical protein